MTACRRLGRQCLRRHPIGRQSGSHRCRSGLQTHSANKQLISGSERSPLTKNPNRPQSASPGHFPVHGSRRSLDAYAGGANLSAGLPRQVKFAGYDLLEGRKTYRLPPAPSIGSRIFPGSYAVLYGIESFYFHVAPVLVEIPSDRASTQCSVTQNT